MSYPKSTVENPKRPYRLWNENEKKAMRWRYYSDVKRAHNGAMVEARWAKKVGTTIAVFNATNGKLLGQYTLRVNGVDLKE